ncbi:MAG TPA: SURF1 family protein [Steroidobacteraceae bacterium]
MSSFTGSKHTRARGSQLILAVGTALLGALFIRLGVWQWNKAESSARAVAEYEERARLPPLTVGERLVDPARTNAVPITARGRYEPQHQIFLDNRQNDGVPGVHVLTPLKIEPGETRLLVNRGWIPWPSGRRDTLPEVPVPDGIVVVKGIAEVPSTKPFFLMPEAREFADRLWPRVDLERFAQLIQHPVQPVVLLQNQDDAQDGLVRRWPPPEDKTLMHRGYAYQWFGMAAALAIFFGGAILRRKTS